MRKRYWPGVVAGLALTAALTACSSGQQPIQAAYVSMDAARTAALNAAAVSAEQAVMGETQMKERDGVAYYQVAFTAGETQYTYDVDAMTGTVIYSVKDVPQGAPATGKTAPQAETAAQTASGITLEQAKQAALKHAGIAADAVTFVKGERDYEHGRLVYEVEFVKSTGSSYAEYDYEIDAATGEVVSYDYDAENYTQPAGNGSAAMLTEDAARKAVLARVPGAGAADVWELKLDTDDGKLLYEGKIVYGETEYEFELDAYSGTVLEWSAESIYD